MSVFKNCDLTALNASLVLTKTSVRSFTCFLRTPILSSDFVKLSKQFTYADKNKYNYVLIYGKEEAEEKVIKIKNLKTGDENKHKLDDSIKNYKF